MTEAQIRAIVEAVVNRYVAAEKPASSSVAPAPSAGVSVAGNVKSVALGADHGGFELKEKLKEFIKSIGYSVQDCGAHSKEAVDYPDLAAAVGRLVAAGKADRGVVIDGAGIGSSIAANKIKGVRAALCYNEQTILNSRLHNDANVLTLGAPFHTAEQAAKLVKLWLQTAFEGGRHQKRIDKIIALEGPCSCAGGK